MSQQDQDALIGRVVRERKEVAKGISLLTAQAARQGGFLKALGGNLERWPEKVAFMGPSTGVGMDNVKWVDVTEFPKFEDIVAVGNELRALIEKRKSLEDEAQRLGI